ncbi:hypothetical protein ABZW47_31765 [Streptomyces sp. NPDC004549]|uniref:hypothetical protein n=1 Tax=Streptomyces sp. NPDC004549 TaxID=3154283 RepID=UPI0033A0C766
MFKYTLPVREFAAQHAHLTSAPTTSGAQEPVTDNPRNPTKITIYAPGPDSALRMATRHLTLLHARLAHSDPGAVSRTAPDVIYAEARARAETLTPTEREEESRFSIHSDDDGLRLSALTDVMRQRGELTS